MRSGRSLPSAFQSMQCPNEKKHHKYRHGEAQYEHYPDNFHTK
jgi:hypothetical protein